MKLGDSLGRRRRRRKQKDEPAADGVDEGAEDVADGDDGDDDALDALFRNRASREPGERTGPRITGRNLVLGTIGLALFGWFFGYGVATQLLFPAPPPPGDLFEIPDLRGLGLASAQERLEGSGLAMGSIDSLQHPSVTAGLILGQSPLPGQVARPETPVLVTVSTGPQRRSVPDVGGLDLSRARVVLETSGFIVEVDSAEAELARGRVVELSPAPGNVVALPAEVRLVVSTGPPTVLMPLVLGLQQGEAEQLLDSLGLVVTEIEEVFRFGRDQGVVVEQEPAADEELQRGSTVTLKVGRQGLEGEQ